MEFVWDTEKRFRQSTFYVRFVADTMSRNSSLFQSKCHRWNPSAIHPVSQPVPKHPRADANVQQRQKELKLDEGIAKIPEIDFNEEIVEYKKIIQTAQKQRLRKSRRP